MDINVEVLRRCGTCRFWGKYPEVRPGQEILSANCEVDRTKHQKTYTTPADGDCSDWEHKDAPHTVVVFLRLLTTMEGLRTQLSRLLIEDKNAVSTQEKKEQKPTPKTKLKKEKA